MRVCGVVALNMKGSETTSFSNSGELARYVLGEYRIECEFWKVLSHGAAIRAY